MLKICSMLKICHDLAEEITRAVHCRTLLLIGFERSSRLGRQAHKEQHFPHEQAEGAGADAGSPLLPGQGMRREGLAAKLDYQGLQKSGPQPISPMQLSYAANSNESKAGSSRNDTPCT